MKHTVLALLACSTLALAQPQPGEPRGQPPPPDDEDIFMDDEGPIDAPPGPMPPDRPGFDEPVRGGPGGHRIGGRGPHDGPFLQRLMEKLRESDPAEFERLQKLRAEDPAAFREALLAKLKEERMEQLRRDRPRIAAALEGMPPKERDWLLDKIREGAISEGPGRDILKNVAFPELAEAERNTRKLADDYRKAGSDEEKNRIRAELQQSLGRVFDLKAQTRAEEIARIEQRVGQLRESLDERRKHRDEIIERRLRELTEADTWAW